MRLGLSASSRGAAQPPRLAASRPPAAAPLAVGRALGPHHLALAPPAAGIAAPRPPARRTCGSGAAEGARCAASIREFIQSECPVAGFDGVFRERQREATLEAAALPVGADAILTPGCTQLLRLGPQQLQQVVDDGGQLLLYVAEGSNASGGAPAPVEPPKGKGSYATLAQAYGLQRLPGDGGGYVRLTCQQRVALQSLRPPAGGTGAPVRARAAVLKDRWAYFVKAQAVEDVLDTAMAADGGSHQETLNLAGQAVEMRTAVASLQDVAQQLQACLAEMQDLLARQAQREAQQPSSGEQAVELLDELERLVSFSELPGGPEAGDMVASASLERLSFAPFAAELLAAYAGMPADELPRVRARAMEATDLGLRLEDALDFASELSSRLAARAALAGVTQEE